MSAHRPLFLVMAPKSAASPRSWPYLNASPRRVAVLQFYDTSG